MDKAVVSIVRYESPGKSVTEAVNLAGGLERIKPGSSVFIKPNIVFWTKAVPFPKWGVITTSRVIEDIIHLLLDLGIRDITIGEGMVTAPKDNETPAHAFSYLGYDILKKKYGIKVVNTMERPFEKRDLGQGISLRFCKDALESDFIIDLPAMKTHNQTVVSLGIKNLKGLIDIPSRKKCHNPDPEKNLHFYVSRLADGLPPVFCLIDGIYTLARGPAFDGKMRRSNILVASWDVLAADMVGAKILGYEPDQVPYITHAAGKRNLPADLSWIETKGESIDNLCSQHEYDFAYSETEEGIMPVPLAKQGIKGIYYRKFDDTMCTYCSGLNGLILSAIRFAWKGQPWDKVEVLTGKRMDPTPGMKKTILLGKCIYAKHKDNPVINEAIAVKGCPPDPKDIVEAFHKAGIEMDPGLFDQVDTLPGFFMSRYQDKPEFDESFFRIEE